MVLFMLIGVGVLSRSSYSVVNYLYVSWETRLSFLVIMWFLFLSVFGMGCVICLWHSLGLPFNCLTF